jgi:hypothetical protein
MQARGWRPVTGQSVLDQYGGSYVVRENDPNTSGSLFYQHPQYGNVVVHTDLPPLVSGPMRVAAMDANWRETGQSARASGVADVQAHVTAIEQGQPMDTERFRPGAKEPPLTPEQVRVLDATRAAQRAAELRPRPGYYYGGPAFPSYRPEPTAATAHGGPRVAPPGGFVAGPGAPRWNYLQRTWVWPQE